MSIYKMFAGEVMAHHYTDRDGNHSILEYVPHTNGDEAICKWDFDDETTRRFGLDCWHTGCGHLQGGNEHRRWKYCPFCGKRIEVTP